MCPRSMRAGACAHAFPSHLVRPRRFSSWSPRAFRPPGERAAWQFTPRVGTIKQLSFWGMTSLRVAATFAGYFRAASLAELEEDQMMIVHGADRPVLLCRHEGQVFALDNRCPHMGFPLSKGSLDYGLLPCHWHHARFDLRSGCTFDLWADDTPAFEVRVEGDEIWVSTVPVQRADAAFHFARLRRGLEENIGLLQAKNIVALLAEGEGANRVIREI